MPILQMKKLRFREVKYIGQNHLIRVRPVLLEKTPRTLGPCPASLPLPRGYLQVASSVASTVLGLRNILVNRSSEILALVGYFLVASDIGM